MRKFLLGLDIVDARGRFVEHIPLPERELKPGEGVKPQVDVRGDPVVVPVNPKPEPITTELESAVSSADDAAFSEHHSEQ
jgi:hypothetical protein